MLSMYVNQYHSDWDEYLPFVIFAYNTNQQSSTKFSPFKILYGRDPLLPTEIELPKNQLNREEIVEFIWPKIKEMVKNNLDKAQSRYAQNYNDDRIEVNYSEGDKVLVRFPNPLPGLANKLFINSMGRLLSSRKRLL